MEMELEALKQWSISNLIWSLMGFDGHLVETLLYGH